MKRFDIVTRGTGSRAASILTVGMSLGVLAACVALVAGCSPEGTVPSGSRAGSSTRDRIAVAGILFQDDQFFRMCEMGMKRAAEQYTVDLQVSNSGNSLDKEVSLVDTYAGQGVKAMAVAPLSVKASIPALKRANDQGIPIVTYDGYIEADFPKSSIMSDQVALGRSTGEFARKYIEQKLGGKAKVALIEYIRLAPEPGGMRVKGFKEAMAGMPGVEIVTEQDAWLAPEAADLVQSILTARPEINLVWAANEGGTVGAVTAVRNAGRQGQVVVFGTDISEQIGDFLLAEDNILQAVTGQKPFDIGFEAIKSCVMVLKGEPVEAKVRLPGTLLTRENPDAVREYQKFLQGLSS